MTIELGKMREKEQETAGVHVWLILWKAFRALASVAEASICETDLGDSDFRILEVLFHKGPLPVNTIGPKVQLTPGSISVAIDRLENKALVRRQSAPEDRRVRRVELTPKGRELISRAFQHHADVMETAVSVLSAAERATLLALLKKLGKGASGPLPS
jgi:MarR family 2-MHQ and catechol resistance regulon transcriptional repressor